MFSYAIRRLLENRWTVLCLLLGYVLLISLTTSIPMYTGGVLQNLLVTEMENLQASTGSFPGNCTVTAEFLHLKRAERKIQTFLSYDEMISNRFYQKVRIPTVAEMSKITIDYLEAVPEIRREEHPRIRPIRLEALSSIRDHIEVTQGRPFSTHRTNGVYEVIATEQMLKDQDLILNETYLASSVAMQGETIKLRLVGVFTAKHTLDPYWVEDIDAYGNSFIMDYGLLRQELQSQESSISIGFFRQAQWHYAMDYHEISSANLAHVVSVFDEQIKLASKMRGLTVDIPVLDILRKYLSRGKELRRLLLFLYMPIVALLAFYIHIVCRLVIANDNNEVYILKSRGGSDYHILGLYLTEGLILCGFALLLGLPLSLLNCTVIGSANGFMEFVQRDFSRPSINMGTLLYSVIASALLIGVMVALSQIVARKGTLRDRQYMSAQEDTIIWRKYFLDFVLLALFLYGYFRYLPPQETISAGAAPATSVLQDPLAFLPITLFILSTSLLFLRFFAIVVSLVFSIRRYHWSSVLYISLIQVARSKDQQHSIMFLITFTLSIGVFNANAARTLNQNAEEQIRYSVGSDMVVMQSWESDRSSTAHSTDSATEQQDKPKQHETYREPPSIAFTDIPGVAKATKVFKKDYVTSVYGSQRISGIQLMGIVPDEFGKTAWFRADLLPSHWYNYLNYLTRHANTFLISESLSDSYGINPGDAISLTWEGQGYLDGTVCAVISYWPTYSPSTGHQGAEHLVVGNLSYIFLEMAVEPYEIWLKKKPGASSENIYKEMEDRDLSIQYIKDASQSVVEQRNDPANLGTNGALSLGFITAVSISFVGFLIYWVISIKKRTLQFGILRGMGLSLGKIMSMLFCEFSLLCGTSVVMGIVLGQTASRVFIPRLHYMYGGPQYFAQFRIVTKPEDYLILVAVFSAMFLAGFAILGVFIHRLKMNQALKLSEE